MQLSDWQIRPDPRDRGLVERWFDPRPEMRDVHAVDGEACWRPISVPSSWNQALGDDETDVAWYRTRVPAGRAPGQRLWLRFGAVCTDLTAWCDGVEIGTQSGNWEPFMLELPAAPDRRVEHEVVLRIDRVRPGPPIHEGKRIIEQGHITRGFHDILSRQPAGLWQAVNLHRTGPTALDVLGVVVVADPDNQSVRIDLRTADGNDSGGARFVIRDEDGAVVAEAGSAVIAGRAVVEVMIPDPKPWSPDSPTLYTLEAVLSDQAGQCSDHARVRFGFRKLTTHNRRILFNDKPILLSAMLDWGHEPMQTSPAPSPAEVRRRFAALRAMGFNCVCVCLWYPPQWYYDIADETGMLLWQEHPVWKPAMHEGNREQFKQHYERFFRMDMNHPSVVVVSGSCEHDAFDDEIAAWWWRRASELMPDRLRQVQTAFLRLVPPEQTDLYDEHTYENSGRWPEFLADMDRTLAQQPPKPYVMGESVLYNDWPDVQGLLALLGEERPWWCSRVLDDAARTEQWIAGRYGHATLERFLRQARDWHRAGRKWQTEVFREAPSHAGLVQNSIRDVAPCPLGFMDDLDRWRLTPQDTRPWLAPNALLLRTPEHMRCLPSGQSITFEVGASCFAGSPIDPSLSLEIEADGVWSDQAEIDPRAGEIAWKRWRIDFAPVSEPTAISIHARAHGAEPNHWRLWLMPPNAAMPDGVLAERRAQGEPHYAFEEASYSSGWGLPVSSWRMREPDPAALLPGAQPIDHANSGKEEVIVVKALTPAMRESLVGGARVLLLPDRSIDTIQTAIPTLWGQSPLIIDRGPLAGIDPDWVLDALDRDLHHRWIRSTPTGRLGLANRVDPYIRLIHTHNAVGRVDIMDDLFAVNVGAGVLLVSTLDHATTAGNWLLHRLVCWLASDHVDVSARIDPGALTPALVTEDQAVTAPG